MDISDDSEWHVTDNIERFGEFRAPFVRAIMMFQLSQRKLFVVEIDLTFRPQKTSFFIKIQPLLMLNKTKKGIMEIGE